MGRDALRAHCACSPSTRRQGRHDIWWMRTDAGRQSRAAGCSIWVVHRPRAACWAMRWAMRRSDARAVMTSISVRSCRMLREVGFASPVVMYVCMHVVQHVSDGQFVVFYAYCGRPVVTGSRKVDSYYINFSFAFWAISYRAKVQHLFGASLHARATTCRLRAPIPWEETRPGRASRARLDGRQ